jgi:hypothetical protein
MSSLELSAWNIQGGLETKLQDDDFTSYLTSNILCLTETWCTDQSVNNLAIPNDYIHLYSYRPNYGRDHHNGGGISLLFQKKLSNFICKLDSSNDDFLFFKIDKYLLQLEQDLYVGVIYIPPENSTSLGPRCHFTDLENDIVKYSKQGHLLLTGDFNARIGKHEDLIFNDSGKFLPCSSVYINDKSSHRQSLDHNKKLLL